MKPFGFSVLALALVGFAPYAQAGSVKGKINFSGTPPKASKINMAADPTCQKANSEPVFSEKVTVNANSTVKDTFVYIKDGYAKKAYPIPAAQKVVLDQKGCRYTPHVFGVMAGQEIQIVNSDPTLHNVHAMPKKNAEFNLGMPMKGMTMTRKFDKPEIGVKFKCDVHPWMRAWVSVMEHPYFAVSNTDGTYEIKDLPAGTYTIATWHSALGEQEQKITVAEGAPATADFTYKADAAKTAAND